MPKYAKHPVKGYEGLYWITKDGRVFNKKRELKRPINKQGYVSITLTKDGKPHGWRVHRLVLLTFMPNPENKPHCNHKNSIRHDNHLTNLEWCTPKENMIHAAVAHRKRYRAWMDKESEKYQRWIDKHPEEFLKRRMLTNERFGALIPQDYDTPLKVLEPKNTGLGRGLGSLIPQNFNALTDDKRISVDNV